MTQAECAHAAATIGTGAGGPHMVVAAIMASLALQRAAVVIRQAVRELRVSVALPVAAE